MFDRLLRRTPPPQTTKLDHAPDDAIPVAIDSNLLDLTLLEETKGKMKAKFPRLLATYLDNTEKFLNEIEQQLSAGSIKDITRAAHTIKSSSKILGAVAVSKCAADLEAEAKAAENNKTALSHMKQQYATLRETFVKSEALLNQHSETGS